MIGAVVDGGASLTPSGRYSRRSGFERHVGPGHDRPTACLLRIRSSLPITGIDTPPTSTIIRLGRALANETPGSDRRKSIRVGARPIQTMSAGREVRNASTISRGAPNRRSASQARGEDPSGLLRASTSSASSREAATRADAPARLQNSLSAASSSAWDDATPPSHLRLAIRSSNRLATLD